MVQYGKCAFSVLSLFGNVSWYTSDPMTMNLLGLTVRLKLHNLPGILAHLQRMSTCWLLVGSGPIMHVLDLHL